MFLFEKNKSWVCCFVVFWGRSLLRRCFKEVLSKAVLLNVFPKLWFLLGLCFQNSCLYRGVLVPLQPILFGPFVSSGFVAVLLV